MIYADVLGMPIFTVKSEQGCALGTTIHASLAAGAYPDVESASAVMGGHSDHVYHPIQQNSDTYDRLFRYYDQLYEMFGRRIKSCILCEK
jgi:L-ribulokinase